jgi:hypothetical protein
MSFVFFFLIFFQGMWHAWRRRGMLEDSDAKVILPSGHVVRMEEKRDARGF